MVWRVIITIIIVSCSSTYNMIASNNIIYSIIINSITDNEVVIEVATKSGDIDWSDLC